VNERYPYSAACDNTDPASNTTTVSIFDFIAE